MGKKSKHPRASKLPIYSAAANKQSRKCLKHSAESILNLRPEDAQKKIIVPESLRRQAASIDFSKIAIPDCSAVPDTVADGFTALHEESSGTILDFDAALEKLKKTEPLQENHEIAYIGSGNFAVVSYEKSSEGTSAVVIHRKIEFEKHHDDIQWRGKLCYSLMLSYTPNPEPLSQLYTPEEESSFPAFS